ncbi:MAG: flagellar hook-basal body complex protein FliE, partial [Treponema sp.]|nr:flagellar hook-basal body complex protein FliE [Treponema sp.]
MKIQEFGTLQMTRTLPAHTGRVNLTDIAGAPHNKIPSSAEEAIGRKSLSFSEYLTQAVQSMNDMQLNASLLGEKILSEPDSVDVHDVSIALSKARMSLNLA